MKSLRPLASFVWYCVRNPQQRFWQALSNWTDRSIYVDRGDGTDDVTDTYFWESRL